MKPTGNADCFTGDNSTATLSGAAIDYTHPRQLPTTVGRILDAGMRSYTVVVPASPSTAETQAGLDAVAALTQRYPSPTTVELAATGNPPTASFLDRVVVVREDATATANSLTVEDNGALVITGPADSLAGAAIALADPNTNVIQTATATSVSAQPAFAVRSGAVPLSEVGNTGVSLVGTGTASSVLNFSQPSFGQQIGKFEVNLVGSMSALIPGSQGRVDLLWNGTLVQSIAMSESTELNTSMTFQGTQVQRDNGLTVQMTYVPPEGKCFAAGLPARVDIDAERSTVSATAGESVPPGFERFPQIFRGIVPVALDGSGPPGADIAQAGQLIAAMQSASSQQLITEVLTDSAFGSSKRAGLLVGGQGATATELGAPVTGNGATVIGPDGTDLSAISGPYGALQAFESGNRNVLLLNGSAAEPGQQAVADERAAALAVFANKPPGRWLALEGQAVLLGPSGTPVTVAVSPPASGWRPNPLLVVGAVVILLLLAIRGWLWWRARGKVSPPPAGGPE